MGVAFFSRLPDGTVLYGEYLLFWGGGFITRGGDKSSEILVAVPTIPTPATLLPQKEEICKPG